MSVIFDQRQRPLRDLRLSVTDRCNFRCVYCMPKEVYGKNHVFLSQSAKLSDDEIERLVRAFVNLGVRKLRLTGGEPSLRPKLTELIARLAKIEGLDDLALTTNGSALFHQAHAWKLAGLHRITVSLDALDEVRFQAMNDVGFPVSRVLEGLDKAIKCGFTPIKINMVVRKGINERDIVAMAKRFKSPHFILRYIEYMDVGNCNDWQQSQVCSAAEILQSLRSQYDFAELPSQYFGEVARRYWSEALQTEIGIVSSISQPFCQDCTRARVTADGQFFSCLFASKGKDLLQVLRGGGDELVLQDHIRRLWSQRDDRYSELRGQSDENRPREEMSRLGG